MRDVANIRRLATLFLAFVFFLGLSARQAQALVFYYTGPAWDTSFCAVHYNPGSACKNGNLSGSVTFGGVSDTYSGTLHHTDLSSWVMEGTSVMSLSSASGVTAISGTFNISNGQMGGVVFQAQKAVTGKTTAFALTAMGSGYDTAADVNSPSGTANAAGWKTTPPAGTWINPKILGRPRSVPAIPSWAPPSPLASTPKDKNPDGCCLSSAGEPVDIASGNMYETVTDYTTVGQNPLAFIRYYNSMATADGYATTLGPKWRHNYDRYLHVVSASEVDAERTDGQIVAFIDVGGVWTPSSDIDLTLTGSGSSYTLTTSDGVAEAYTVASGKGTLDSITFLNGYTQTLAYSSGKLSTVTDSYSRVLTLSYTGNDLTGVSTPDSATLAYGYTSTVGQDLLTSVTYNTSPSTNQTYVYGKTDYPFALTSITDENGNSYASWTYDTLGRCTSSQFAGGADYTQLNFFTTNVVKVTNPLGELLTYTFTIVKGVPRVSSIARAANSPVAAATRNFTYDANGYLATATDWEGNSTHWTNNSHGLPTSITEAYGVGLARTTTISYDANCPWKPEVITKTNLIVTNDWDNTTCDLLTTTYEDDTGGSTDGQTHVWTYTYTSYGLLNTVTEPRTDTTITTTYGYTSGALTSITDDMSHVTTMNTVNGSGQPTQITDPNGVVTDLVYNNRNWLTNKTINAGTDEVTAYTYIGSGQPDVITLPDSSTIDYDYDAAQRLTKITNAAGETINYTLNAMGKPTAVTLKDSGGNTKKSFTATYDVLGDMLTLVGSGGGSQTTTFAYDKMQNRTSTTDANSRVWAQAWDALLRPSTVTDPLTHTAAPTYNNLDYVTAQTDFLGYSTGYTRDGFGNAIARSSPDTGAWSFTFDENNNVTAITDARSVASTLAYDSLNRISTLSISGYSGENTSWTYDDTTGGNKGVGRLTSWSDESGSGSRVYDNFANVTSETRVIGGKTYTTTYGYDLANRITEIIYPSGRYVDYSYDSSGYLTTVTTKPSAMGGVTTLASSITHKPFGPIASFTFGNSEAHTRTYDNNYWLTDIDTVNGGTYVQRLDYGHDNAGNLTSITDNIDATRNETLTVDQLNRLSAASGKYGSRTYTFDNNSGRATRVAGATTYTTTRVASKNRVDHISDGSSTRNFTWTANGNMATDDRTFVGGGAAAFTYGGRNRLESMTIGGNGITYKVNAFGQRVSEAFSGNTTHYVHDILGNIVAEANGSTGATTKEYVWMEGELLAQIDSGGNVFYAHNSQVGLPQKMTDASRNVVWDQIIEPFGEVQSTPTSATPTSIRFPGQYANANNSLFYNNARSYDPTGFYPEADPAGLAGGLNLYAYAGQNPMQVVDPSGRSGVIVGGIAALGEGLYLGCRAFPTACARALAGVIGTSTGFVGGTKLLNEAKDDAAAKPAGQCPEPEELKGKTPEEVDEIMEDKGWKGEPSANEQGTRYPNPDKPGEQVRVQAGNRNDPNPIKRGPYVRISRNGGVSDPIPLAGNPTIP